MIIATIILELILSPLAYLKVIYNFYNTSTDLLLITFMSSLWIAIGPVILALLILMDLFYMFRILLMHRGCRDGLVDELEEERVEEKKRVQIFNETRESIILLYEKIKR